MMRVKVEIVPFGVEEDAHVIETINVANMGYVDLGQCEYHVWRNEDPRAKNPRPKPDLKVDHMRSNGALRLVQKVVNGLLDGVSE